MFGHDSKPGRVYAYDARLLAREMRALAAEHCERARRYRNDLVALERQITIDGRVR